jgi:hypothetical protein
VQINMRERGRLAFSPSPGTPGEGRMRFVSDEPPP